jgi:hypothetical protein
VYARAEECAAAGSRGATSAFIGLARFTGRTSLRLAKLTLLPPFAGGKHIRNLLINETYGVITAL